MTPEPGTAALFTDLYELTMAASYHAHGLLSPATFDLFTRELPPRRGYLVACGLDDVLDYLEQLRFGESDLAYLASLGLFTDRFLQFLADLRFTGEVWAIPEGDLVFPGEPIVRVTAPMVEAQIVETYLLNCLGFQTMIATKATRIATACAGRSFVDFSPRRDHGCDAAVKAARAAYVGGAAGTSLVAAGKRFGLPLSGTMAHSYVMRFEDERDAFLAYARDFPGSSTLLIDTYDTENGARHVVEVAAELHDRGARPRAVRLDSGDLAQLAPRVRRILDDGGLTDVQIFASGDLDEFRIADLIAAGVPIDAFGVGTQLGTSADAPYIGVVYKLVEDSGGPKIKLSHGKATVPGRKQVYRLSDGDTLSHDVVALEAEPSPGGRPVLEQVMVEGRRVAPAPPLTALRERCANVLASLPARLRAIEPVGSPYEVRFSPRLAAIVRELNEQHAR